MKCYDRPGTSNQGFTLIEVIAVLIVIAILTAFAVSRVWTGHDLYAETDVARSYLRFAQLKALHDDTADTAPWGIAFGSTSYTLEYNNAAAPIPLPSENSNTRSFPPGITVTNPTMVRFDSWGSPGTGDITVLLRGNGGTAALTVTRDTGFIP